MMTTTANVRFTINFVKKEITGSKASFKKAGKGFGPEYEELAAKIAKHPTFALVEIEPKKRSNKKKETYDGLNEPFMRDYIKIQENADKLNTELDKVKALAKEGGKSVYPLMKKWFLDTFSVKGNFDMDKARAEISKHLIDTVRVADAKNEAETKSEAESESESESAEQAIEKKGEVITLPEEKKSA